MFCLSETDRINAKADALRTLTAHANDVISDRLSTREIEEGEISALMSTQWAPGLVRAVGADQPRNLLKSFRNDVFTSGECKIFRDTSVRATDGTIPIYASAWRIWHALIFRFRLFGITEFREWVTLLARFDSKGSRTPHSLARTPCGELSRVDWECRPHPPDIILLTWQAARQDCGGFPVATVGQEPPPL